jgi:hypothetical protein
MTHTTKRFQCRHIFTQGHRCGGPCLRHEEFCYYHHTTRRPIQDLADRRARQSHFSLAMPEDRAAIQVSIGEVLLRIASNEIDTKRAGLLLYGLQIASLNLPRDPQPTRPSRYGQTRFEGPETALIEDIEADPTLGTLAPRAELNTTERRSQTIVGRLLEELDREEALEAQQRAQQQEAHPQEAQQPQTQPQTPDPEPTILPTLEAHHSGPGKLHRHRKSGPRTSSTPISPEKSQEKLTRQRRIAIVRRFREYPDRVVGSSRNAEGGSKAHAIPESSSRKARIPAEVRYTGYKRKITPELT